MKNIHLCLLFSILEICVSLEHVWHSYQYDPVHKSREEVVITNITADADFKLDSVVTKWTSLHVEKACYLAGLMAQNVAITSLTVNSSSDSFLQKSYTIDLEFAPIDVALFHYWNVTSQNYDAMVVIATKKPQLLWYRINETNFSLFWTWPITKNISHINVFQMEYDYHLLMITQHLSHTTADIYEFVPKDTPNFWLRQKLELSDPAISSATSTVGPDNYIAIPQESLDALLIYKLKNNHFVSYKNISSENIDHVVAFRVGQKSFLAFNGLEAGIYRFTRKDLIKESVVESHLEGVNYWLPISLTVYGDDTILTAQRSLSHGIHKSYVIEIITYNGERFEEHEDIPCLYFGEELNLSCLPDDEAQMGIAGSVAIFLDDVLGILVPRRNRSSELFLVKTQLKKIPNPVEKQIEEFVKMKQHINEVIAVQETRRDRIAAGQSGDLSAIKEQLREIEELVRNKTEQERLPHYDTVTFKGVVKVTSSGVFDEVEAENINGEPASFHLKDIVLKNNLEPITSPKTFANLEVKDLIAETINDVDSTELLFDRDNIELRGEIFLTNPLTVLEDVTAMEVNGLDFAHEVIDFVSPINDLTFENLEISGHAVAEKINDHQLPTRTNAGEFCNDTLFIPGNVDVLNVNGEDFNKFLSELCLRNIRNYIPGDIKVNGDVTVLENAEVEFINNVKFPEEYVFVDNSLPNITGAKHFAGTLTTSVLNCEETIDEISPSQIMTLSTDQQIPGTTTFKHLTITESLNVEGNITGEHASKFLPNPTLLQANFIKSKVHFKNLEVQGAIIVTENFNGKNLESQLSDVVYTDEEHPIIEAIKHFPEGFIVRKNLLVASNSINNVTLDSIVTTNTEQILNLTTLKGVVNFGSVETEGEYNTIDVKKLDGELVKLDGEQYISSELIFEEDVDVNKLEIIKSAKNLSNDLDALDAFLEVENILIEGNLDGNIDGFNIEDFNRNRMSFTRDQFIEEDFVLDKSTVTNLLPFRINGMEPDELTQASCEQKLTQKFLDGKLAVENLHSNSVEIDEIDGQRALNLAGSFWKHDLKKHNTTKLILEDGAFFENVEIEKLSGANFYDFANNILFKNETDVKIKGRKVFSNGLHVEKLIETENLNNVPLSNILTRHGAQEILGPITIQGDVVFENNVTVAENINDVNIKEITDIYQVVDEQFRITGDVLFNRLVHIYNLQIEGYVNDRQVQEVMDGIIYVDDDFALGALITFENKVNMEKNIRVKGKINNVDLTAFVSDMVMITKDATIKSPVRFAEEVLVDDQIVVHKKFTTNDLNGIDFRSWNDKAIFVTEGLLKGDFLFKDVRVVDALVTDFINDIDMKTLIPLRTRQSLPDLNFHQISLFKDVSVGNSTNFRNLPDELANSVLISSDQDVDSEIEFRGNVFFEDDIDLVGSVNGIETNRIVTTNTDQELEAIYRFKSKTNLERNLIVEGLLNGIDLEQWSTDGVKIASQSSQNITDNWLVDQDLILEGNMSGNGLINGIDLRKFSEDVEEKRNYKYELEKEFIDDYRNICKDLTYMYDKLKKQIYKFNYLENLQTLNFPHKIEHVYSYKYHNHTHVLVNEQNNCESHLFIFDSRFRYVHNVHLGQIAQIISVHYDDSIYLVIRNRPFYSSCKVQGTNIWQLNDDEFTHLANIENQDLLQESLEPGTFYGIRKHVVTEFKILPKRDMVIRKYRKWQVEEDNMAFVPRGLATGLAIRTGRKLIKLHRVDPIVDNFSEETEEIILGNVTKGFNTYLPGRKDSDLVVMKVGIKSNKRNLLAVASHEEMSVKGSLDFIKIYEDVIAGKVFHKVPSYKPSSLLALEFNNGETLLAFMEDESVLQVYEYKGIEGFKHKLSVKLEGSKLFTTPLNLNGKENKVIGLIDKNKISFMEVVMLGNQVDSLHCSL